MSVFFAFSLAAHGNAATASEPLGATVPLHQKEVVRPLDKPQSMHAQSLKTFDEAMKPFIARAKASLPAAKERYLKGLPDGEIFYVTTRLRDPDGKFEQVFVLVKEWSKDTASGTIASTLGILQSYKKGQTVDVLDKDIMDWTIAKNDGSEEGNLVGKFLDTYKQ